MLMYVCDVSHYFTRFFLSVSFILTQYYVFKYMYGFKNGIMTLTYPSFAKVGQYGYMLSIHGGEVVHVGYYSLAQS